MAQREQVIQGWVAVENPKYVVGVRVKSNAVLVGLCSADTKGQIRGFKPLVLSLNQAIDLAREIMECVGLYTEAEP